MCHPSATHTSTETISTPAEPEVSPTHHLSSGSHLPVAFEREQNVCIGNNIWIENTAWEQVLSYSTQSMFVKQLGVAIWGTPGLAARRMQTLVSNKARSLGSTDPHMPITPEKQTAVNAAIDFFSEEKQPSRTVQPRQVETGTTVPEPEVK